MNKVKLSIQLGILGMLALTHTGCHDHDHEEELITSVKIIAVDPSGGTSSAMFSDPDGDGGAAPTKFETLVLKPNTTYKYDLLFLDESVSPAVDRTVEVVTEGKDHQIYMNTNPTELIVSNMNTDANGLPLGTKGDLKTLAAGTYKLPVVLKHKPGKKKAGDAITVGETDIELPNGGFKVEVKN